MPLRICIECGAPVRRAACRECGASPPAWVAEPVTLTGALGRAVLAAVCSASAAALLAGIYLLCSGWVWPGWILRAVQVGLAVIMVVFGGLAGVGLLHLAFTTLFQREHRHEQPEGGRRGEARALFGRLLDGHGQATRWIGAFDPGAPALRATAVFRSARHIDRALGQAMGSNLPKTVDLAVAAAILGLASRGRLTLEHHVMRTWSLAEGKSIVRPPPVHVLLVKRAPGDRAEPLDEGWLEEALLAALGPSAPAAPTPAAALGPYRASPGVEAKQSPGDEAAIPVDVLVDRLTGPRRWAREGLRRRLREEARHAQASEGRELPPDDAIDALRRSLVALLGRPRRTAARSPGAEVLAGVTASLSRWKPPADEVV